jgi:hypothetical protein
MMPLYVFQKLLTSLYEHVSVEHEVRKFTEDILEKKYIRKKRAGMEDMKYLQKNIFSILFLSIYRAIGIPRERRLFYGVINHCLRGLVTATDNILDNEYKEMLPLDFPDDAYRFKSVMHILLFDRFMFRLFNSACDSGMISREQAGMLNREIFNSIVPIGAEEAGEEGGVRNILKPAEILSSVHKYKGGKLLCLAFVAPGIIEVELLDSVRQAEQGVFSIGMALQVIDDITDFYNDIRDSRHNYLVSAIYHEGQDHEKEHLMEFLAGKTTEMVAVEKLYGKTLGRVMEQALGEALAGFEMLEKAGYWLNRHNAISLIHSIFHLRGVKYLLDFLPEDHVINSRLGDFHDGSDQYTGKASESCGMAL